MALQQQVEELVAMGVDKIVALGHSGFDVDQEVARRVRGVDVVIGGHSNTFLYTGRQGLLLTFSLNLFLLLLPFFLFFLLSLPISSFILFLFLFLSLVYPFNLISLL